MQPQQTIAGSSYTPGKQQEVLNGTQAAQQAERAPMVICLLDNRGYGRSSTPQDKKQYSTELMAKDVVNVMVRTWYVVVCAAQSPFITHCQQHQLGSLDGA